FAVFPWHEVTTSAVGADIGCGSGRWARFVAPRARAIACVDPSTRAASVARMNLAEHPNCGVVVGAAGALPIRDGALDFGYSLGVLHHTPDPHAALKDCVRVLRPGAPFLIYIYYALDNRPRWFRITWRVT